PINIPVSGRVFQVNNEIQIIQNLNGVQTGNWRINFKGGTPLTGSPPTLAPALLSNASTTDVYNYLVSLKNADGTSIFGANDVTVDGFDGGPYVVTFQGALAGKVQPN